MPLRKDPSALCHPPDALTDLCRTQSNHILPEGQRRKVSTQMQQSVLRACAAIFAVAMSKLAMLWSECSITILLFLCDSRQHATISAPCRSSTDVDTGFRGYGGVYR